MRTSTACVSRLGSLSLDIHFGSFSFDNLSKLYEHFIRGKGHLTLFFLLCFGLYQAWRERKEKHLRDLEEKVRLYESEDSSVGKLYEENERLKALVSFLDAACRPIAKTTS